MENFCQSEKQANDIASWLKVAIMSTVAIFSYCLFTGNGFGASAFTSITGVVISIIAAPFVLPYKTLFSNDAWIDYFAQSHVQSGADVDKQ